MAATDMFVVLLLVVALLSTARQTGVRPADVRDRTQNVSLSDAFPADNGTASSDAAIDVQYTSCKVITDRIVATAEGKFSRFCRGICNITETNAKLHRIETLLTADAEHMKSRLYNLERTLFDGNNVIRRSDIHESGGGGGQQPLLAAGDTGRLREIGTYNGTVFAATDGGGRPVGRATSSAFVYYWRVDAFWRLTFADGGSGGRARSPPFYVSPRSYRIALTVHSDPAAGTVRVAAVNAAGEYDAGLRWPFAHRIRLSVLDQTDVGPEDIVSRVWDDVRCGVPASTPPAAPNQLRLDDVCASMEFRHGVLTHRRYAAGDALLVKLTVFLQ
ncbi:TRAF-like [Cinara cedri]|uniref:TRAF-like n=1 Tax=Cinara cedri TaxID=506608 RepID=A0A5E4ME83_9HEMI|nr:TRAF-like [Cinara cedri]